MTSKSNWTTIRKILGVIATLLVPLLLVLVIVLAYKEEGFWAWDWSPAQLTPVVGIITFFGVLLISNLFSGESNMRNGEVRHAIAASILSVFYYVLAVLIFTAPDSQLDNETVKDVLDNFITMVAVVISFYFGTRSTEEIIKNWRKKSSDTTTTTITQPPADTTTTTITEPPDETSEAHRGAG
ncbi:MAG: hypothetical protein FD146_1273 [Anaerolineaceae bacterium]|nr:MAG: hypothetical protein FD146_1273 [Anaerolineaceae bacterium]